MRLKRVLIIISDYINKCELVSLVLGGGQPLQRDATVVGPPPVVGWFGQSRCCISLQDEVAADAHAARHCLAPNSGNANQLQCDPWLSSQLLLYR